MINKNVIIVAAIMAVLIISFTASSAIVSQQVEPTSTTTVAYESPMSTTTVTSTSLVNQTIINAPITETSTSTETSTATATTTIFSDSTSTVTSTATETKTATVTSTVTTTSSMMSMNSTGPLSLMATFDASDPSVLSPGATFVVDLAITNTGPLVNVNVRPFVSTSSGGLSTDIAFSSATFTAPTGSEQETMLVTVAASASSSASYVLAFQLSSPAYPSTSTAQLTLVLGTVSATGGMVMLTPSLDASDAQPVPGSSVLTNLMVQNSESMMTNFTITPMAIAASGGGGVGDVSFSPTTITGNVGTGGQSTITEQMYVVFSQSATPGGTYTIQFTLTTPMSTYQATLKVTLAS